MSEAKPEASGLRSSQLRITPSFVFENVLPGSGWEIRRAMAAEYLVVHAFDYERMSKEEIEPLFPGTHGNTQLNDGSSEYSVMSWKSAGLDDVIIMDFTTTGWDAVAVMDADDGKATFKVVAASGSGKNEVGDGTIADGDYLYEVRKIRDGHYLLRMIDRPGHSTSAEDIYALLYACDSEGTPKNSSGE